jgi:hypothetical protein
MFMDLVVTSPIIYQRGVQRDSFVMRQDYSEFNRKLFCHGFLKDSYGSLFHGRV